MPDLEGMPVLRGEPENNLSSSKKPVAGWVLLILVILIVFGADAYGMYAVFTSKETSACDFFPRWVCARMLFLEGKSPYSDEVTHITQRGLYDGRLARPGEDQVAFSEPIYSTFFAAPLIFFPYPIAQAIWMAFLQGAILTSVVLGMKMYGWRPPPWMFAVTCVWAVLQYNAGTAILVGQYAVVVLLAVTLVLWALWLNHDFGAGALLALGTVKPQMVFLLIPLLLIWALLKRRWSVVVGFVAAMVVLVGSGMLFVPTWVLDSLSGMQRYATYTAYGSPVWLITEYYFPFLGHWANLGLSAALLLYLLWSWRNAASWGWEELSWGIGLVLVITKFVAPRTATTNYVMLMLPLLLIFRTVSIRIKGGNLLILAYQAASLVGFWALFALTIVTDRGLNLPQENPVMYLPLPVVLLVFLVLGRKWIVRSSGSDRQDASRPSQLAVH